METVTYTLTCKTEEDTQQVGLLIDYLYELDRRAAILLVEKYGVKS